jgi:hypothetical protein
MRRKISRKIGRKISRKIGRKISRKIGRKIRRKIGRKIGRKKKYNIRKISKKKFKGGAEPIVMTSEMTSEMTSSIDINNKIKVSYTQLGASGGYGEIFKVTNIIKDGVQIPADGIVLKKLNETPENVSIDDLNKILYVLSLNTDLPPTILGIFCLNDTHEEDESNNNINMRALVARTAGEENQMKTFIPRSPEGLKKVGWGQLDTTERDKYCPSAESNCFFMKKLKYDINVYKSLSYIKKNIEKVNLVKNKNINIKTLFTSLIELYKYNLLCLDIRPQNVMYDENGTLYIIDPDGFIHYKDTEYKFPHLNFIPLNPSTLLYMPSLYTVITPTGDSVSRQGHSLRKINIFLSSLYLLMKLFMVDIYYNFDVIDLKVKFVREADSAAREVGTIDWLKWISLVAGKGANLVNSITDDIEREIEVAAEKMWYHIITENIILKDYSPKHVFNHRTNKCLNSITEQSIQTLFKAIIDYNLDKDILGNTSITTKNNQIITNLTELIDAIPSA